MPVTACSSLSTLYVSHAREVRAHISRKLKSQQDVDDLVQEVFLRAHRAVLMADNVVRPRAYLHQVAGSVVADYFRKRQRRCAVPQEAEESIDENSVRDEATPEEIAIGDETWHIVCASIARLPLKVRQAISLRAFEELSYREVAEAMGISVRTVEKHLARALADLREAVAGDGNVP
jgi:RNA polymerase sigma factor (sigma-70 family)